MFQRKGNRLPHEAKIQEAGNSPQATANHKEIQARNQIYNRQVP
jgi:hypothetical protein